tara:strand:- start:8245 stop:8613 length:369 start_codon:yes stop_codon:yes gene_type:complete
MNKEERVMGYLLIFGVLVATYGTFQQGVNILSGFFFGCLLLSILLVFGWDRLNDKKWFQLLFEPFSLLGFYSIKLIEKYNQIKIHITNKNKLIWNIIKRFNYKDDYKTIKKIRNQNKKNKAN